jgi:hypothetical protein
MVPYNWENEESYKLLKK